MQQLDNSSQENKDSTSSNASLEFKDSKMENETPLNIDKSNQHDLDRDRAKTVSELEFTLKEKDIEIDKLRKLSAKYERLLEKANKYSDDLRHELDVLSSQLHTYRTAEKREMKSVYIQVTDLEIEDAYGNKPMPVWSTDNGQSSGELSIAECLKAAAEAELQNQLQDVTACSHSECEGIKPEVVSEYVFDVSTGLYYHSGTGYYWDPNSGLFYDYTTGTYYKYNETTGEYEVHSQVEVSGQAQIPDTENKKIKNKRQKKHRSRTKKGESNVNSSLKLQKHEQISDLLENNDDTLSDKNVGGRNTTLTMKQKESVDVENLVEEDYREDKMLIDDPIEHETIEHDSESPDSHSSSDSESSSESGELTSESSSSDVEMIEIEHLPVAYEPITEMAEEYPPCIRVIVQSSERLKCGSLYIITCTGGCIGREKNKGLAIEIDDINVSKLHAEFIFDYEENCYMLTDKGSQNGTVLNGVKLSKSESSCCKLHHDDLLQIGSTTFLLHIHKGSETCDSCEPGQVQARIKAANTIKNAYPVMSQEEKKRQRLRELKNIKKKYGLQNSYYETCGSVYTNSDYTDKAYLRRKVVGSESELTKHNAEPVSVHSPISAQNKGHKLLARMGWKEGEGLGKTSSGISEPITVEMRINQSAGLGANTHVSLSLDNIQHAHKAKRWSQARRRYEQLKDLKNSHTSVSGYPLTNNDPVKESHSQPLPVSSSEISSAGLYYADSCSSTESPSLSLPTFARESTTVSGSVKDTQHVIQASQRPSQQSKPKITWVKGVTEQIGQFVSPSSPSGNKTENT